MRSRAAVRVERLDDDQEAGGEGRPLHPSDPRCNPLYRPRGPRRFGYTYAEIADAAGVTVAAVRKAATSRERGRRRLDLGDLGALVDWIAARRGRR